MITSYHFSFKDLFLSAMPCVLLPLLLSGCSGLQNTAAPSAIVMGAITGTVHGGPNPIVGGTVRLWQTTSGGYGAAAMQLGPSTTTNSLGYFAFDPVNNPYTCATGQYVYVTVTGGNTGGFVSNPNSIQMAALGSCSHFDTAADENNIHIYVGELSTVAAAYALGNFISINQNTGAGAGQQLVYVGAPANNNAATGTCTGIGSAMTCASAGLGHAFANAANLVDAVRFDGTTPTGLAYSAPPSNRTGSVPQALINTIGNLLQSCTNSSGGAAGDSSPCGNLFAYTTPANSTNGAATTAPTDELQATINMAKSPTHNVAALFNLATPVGAFSPTLPVAPSDLSIAIWYAGTDNGSTTTSFGYPESLALDANDNVYVLMADAATPTSSGVAGITSSGGYVFANPLNNTYCQPTQIATDTLSNVWYTNSSLTSTVCPGGTGTYAILGFNTGTGTQTHSITGTPLATSPSGIAFDRLNNLWYTRKSSTSRNIYGLFQGNATTPYTLATDIVTLAYGSTNSALGIAIDANQNVWAASAPGSAATGSVGYFPMVYGLSTNAAGALYQQNLPGTYSSSIAIDGSGNAWAPNAGNVSKLSVVSSGGGTVYSIKSFGSTAATTTFGTTATTMTAGQYVTISGLTSTSGALYDGYTFNLASVSSGANFKVSNLYANAVTTVSDTGSATVAATVSGIAAPTNTTTTAAVPVSAQFDGAGTMWYASNDTTGGVYYFVPSASTSQNIVPCYLPSAATTCANGTENAGGLQVDSTGSIWLAAGTSGSVVQIIGSAASTWPQMSYGHPGKMPQ